VVIHEPIESDQLRRILPQQMGCELRDSRPGPGTVGGQVERTQRTDFPKAAKSGVCFDLHDRAVEDGDRLATRPFVAALVQG